MKALIWRNPFILWNVRSWVFCSNISLNLQGSSWKKIIYQQWIKTWSFAFLLTVFHEWTVNPCDKIHEEIGSVTVCNLYNVQRISADMQRWAFSSPTSWQEPASVLCCPHEVQAELRMPQTPAVLRKTRFSLVCWQEEQRLQLHICLFISFTSAAPVKTTHLFCTESVISPPKHFDILKDVSVVCAIFRYWTTPVFVFVVLLVWLRFSLFVAMCSNKDQH